MNSVPSWQTPHSLLPTGRNGFLQHKPEVVYSPSKEPCVDIFSLIEKWNYLVLPFQGWLPTWDLETCRLPLPHTAVPDLPSVSNWGCLVYARSVKPWMKDAWGPGTGVDENVGSTLPATQPWFPLINGWHTTLHDNTESCILRKQTFSWSSAESFLTVWQLMWHSWHFC